MAGDVALQRAAGRQTDEGSVRDIGQSERSLPSLIVSFGKDQDKRVIPKRELFDRVGQGGCGGNANISRTGRKGCGDIGTLSLLDIEADRRIGGQELGEDLRQMLAKRSSIGKKANTAR
jgi:hypothetical protein